MIENPWLHVPDGPPYVLPCDSAAVKEFNDHASPNFFLHLDKLMPEPFIGNKDAPVVLLSNNPGIPNAETCDDYYGPSFMRRMRVNLNHEPSAHPFFLVAPDHNGRGRRWWDRKLKHLLKEFDREIVARSILNITFFPYPSRRFGHVKLRLPSQEYGFQLVRQAMKRRAVIVHMRKDEMWLSAIDKLVDYDQRFQVSNTQNPAISPVNLGRDFQVVVKAIRTLATKA